MPVRIQRQRKAGWQKPEGAVYVGRGLGQRWGNPWKVVGTSVRLDGVTAPILECGDACEARRIAVRYFRLDYLPSRPDLVDAIRTELAGKTLMCWCPEDQPCHADVLLRIASAPDGAGLCERCWQWDAHPDEFARCPDCGRPWSRVLAASDADVRSAS